MKRRRSALLVLVALVAAVVVTALLNQRGPVYSADLDPGNPSGNGGQALARVLTHQGVDVTVARSAAELDAAPGGPDATVVVSGPEQLGPRTLRRLRDHLGGARLVVLGGGGVVAERFGADPVTVPEPGRLEARCDDERFAGLELVPGVGVQYAGSTGCFPGSSGPALVESGGATLMGAPDALSNDQILGGDNAAIGLRLLGEHPRLVWYVPTVDDLAVGQGLSARSLLPRWLFPALLMLLVSSVGVVLWRGRRLGPLAREPLPVSVLAVETTQSRGRLYRRAGDRGHAGDALRGAARRRAAARLRLPATAAASDVVRAVAARTQRPERDVAALMDPHAAPPATDHDLIQLARGLADIDREVSRD